MRKLILLGVVIAGLCRAQDVAARVEEYVNAHVKMNQFSGSVLVARDGKPLVAKGYGLASIELGVPNAPQTKFRLGSITKQFTAAAILQLAEKGKLVVEDPVSKHMPDAPPAWQQVTIHHLLSHTSGIPSFTSMPDYRKTVMMPTTMDGLLARFRDKPLEFDPGTKYRYSNSGYVLLGYLVEKISGRTYEQYVKENIFDPLGMRSTGYDRFRTVLPMRAAGYARLGDSPLNASYIDMSIPHGAGALYSTVEDLLLWDQGLYGDKVLSGASRERMYKPVLDDYAYGWATRPVFNRRVAAHGGGIEGFSTFIHRFLDDKVTVIVLSNFEGAPSGRIARDVAAIVFGEKYETPKERVAIKIDPALFDAYSGKYRLREGFDLTITREGERFMTQATGQGKLEIFPESETKFFARAIDAQIAFVKDASGKVSEIILFQGGGEIRAKRIEP